MIINNWNGKLDTKSADNSKSVKNNNILKHQNNYNCSPDKVFSNLSFGAALSQAMLKIQAQNYSQKSEIDDIISNLLFDIKKGNLKTDKTEIEEALNVQNFIIELLNQYADEDEKDSIMLGSANYLLRGKNIQLNEKDKKYLSDFLSKYDKKEDEISDKKLIINASSKTERILKSYNDSLYSINTSMQSIKKFKKLSDEEFNEEAIYQNFEENIAPKLSFDELDIVKEILSPFKIDDDKQTAIKKAKFDYTLLPKRRITSFVNKNNYNRFNYYNEFLFCSDKEFEEKITKLNNRAFLKQTLNDNNMPFSLWKKLLDMSDKEYNKLSVPFEKREIEDFDAAKYKKEIQAKIKEPLQFDKKEIDALSREYFNISSIFEDNDYNNKFRKRIDFEKLEQKPAAKSILPDTDTLLNKLNEKGSVLVKIPNRGGANPLNNEKALIKQEDTENLGKRENAGIKIKYGSKINWSNEKISRDIVQNFFDANGYTLEGTTFRVVKKADGKYTVRVEGAANYDYSHLQSIGDSTKDNDALSAGNYGEGTKIVAVNLLSKLGTSYVKYGCGEWSMEFNRSSDDIKTADMTQTLTKNPKKIYGNYIEFDTDNEELVKSILDAKDYFYHRDNPDFQNLDYENEYFGFKFTPYQKGNLYLVQRYEHNGRISNSMSNISVIFKTNPNSEELVKLNNGEKYNPNTGRDRIAISNETLHDLYSRYLKTVKDEDIAKIICTLEPVFNTDTSQNFAGDAFILLNSLVNEAERRGIGINFDNYIAADKKEDIDYAEALGYKTAISQMKRVGMKSAIKEKQKEPVIEPDEKITSKIRLLNEGVKVFEECIDLNTINLIHPGDADTPKYPFNDKEFTRIKAEAIIEEREYKGHWVKSAAFMFDDYIDNLATWLHELSHKSGGDNSAEFSVQLIEMQKFLMKVLANNPNALEKIKILAELYNNQKLNDSNNFNEKEYEMSVKNSLSKIQSYEKYVEADNEIPIYSIPQKPKIYKKRTKEISEAPKSKLPSAEDVISEVKLKGSSVLKIKNTGKTNPVNIEKALIKQEDEKNLGKIKNARIKVKYGAKINWDNEKISRDIMQNFFDGNGYTLDGTKFNITKNDDGKYTIRIEGLGNYDYSHLQSLGDSTKDDEDSAAGKFGEGTRIVAVNLLSKLDTNYVKYGSGDWSMEFKRSSEDITTADMTQTLTKNPQRINGNYIEFNTDNEDLVKSILEAKDYFYHSDNPDFQNLDFENEYFGFRVQKDNGNLYYIQRFQTPDGRIKGGLRGLNLIFKKQEEAVKKAVKKQEKPAIILEKPKIEIMPAPKAGNKSIYERISGFFSGIYKKIFSKPELPVRAITPDLDFSFAKISKKIEDTTIKSKRSEIIRDDILLYKSINPVHNSLNTGRDRNFLSLDDIYHLSLQYAQTMSEDDLVSAIENFEELITSDNPDDFILNKNYDPTTTFISGIIQEANNRQIKINSEDAKIVWVPESSWGNKLEPEVESYLKAKGYKFGHELYSRIGIKSAMEVFNNEHKKQSVEPTQKELQKLEILNKALMLIKENDIHRHLPSFDENPLRIYEKGGLKQNRDYHSVLKDNKLESLLIDRKKLEEDDFFEALANIISETVNRTGNILYSHYSYSLTDLMRLELESLLTKSENVQKLKILEKLYKQIDNQ